MLMWGVGSPREHKEPGLRSSDLPDHGSLVPTLSNPSIWRQIRLKLLSDQGWGHLCFSKGYLFTEEHPTSWVVRFWVFVRFFFLLFLIRFLFYMILCLHLAYSVDIHPLPQLPFLDPPPTCVNTHPSPSFMGFIFPWCTNRSCAGGHTCCVSRTAVATPYPEGSIF